MSRSRVSIEEKRQRKKTTNKAWYERNRAQKLISSESWSKANPEKRHEITRKHAWKVNGISMTIQEYNEIRKKQNFRCAICRISESELTHELCVDHDHETGANRGLLCKSCNLGLGYFKDNPLFLESAFHYLSGLGYF